LRKQTRPAVCDGSPPFAMYASSGSAKPRKPMPPFGFCYISRSTPRSPSRPEPPPSRFYQELFPKPSTCRKTPWMRTSCGATARPGSTDSRPWPSTTTARNAAPAQHPQDHLHGRHLLALRLGQSHPRRCLRRLHSVRHQPGVQLNMAGSRVDVASPRRLTGGED
jgi:hypothetical protein